MPPVPFEVENCNFSSVEEIYQALGWDHGTFSSFKKYVRENARRHGLDPLVSSPEEQPNEWKCVVDQMVKMFPTLVNYASCWPVKAYYDRWAYHKIRDKQISNSKSYPTQTQHVPDVVVPGSANHVGSLVNLDAGRSNMTAEPIIGVSAVVLLWPSSNTNCAPVRIVRPAIGPENVEFKLPDDPSSGSQLSKISRPSANEVQVMVLAPEKLRAAMCQNEGEFWNMRYELASLFQMHMEVPTTSALRWVDVDEVKWGTFAEKAGARYPMFLEYEGNWALEVIVRSCLRET